MDKKYILLQPDEDGEPVHWLNKEGLQGLLDDPKGEWSIESVDSFIDQSDPEFEEGINYWDDKVMLLEVKRIIKPKEVTKSLSIDEN